MRRPWCRRVPACLRRCRTGTTSTWWTASRAPTLVVTYAYRSSRVDDCRTKDADGNRTNSHVAADPRRSSVTPHSTSQPGGVLTDTDHVIGKAALPALVQTHPGHRLPVLRHEPGRHSNDRCIRQPQSDRVVRLVGANRDRRRVRQKSRLKTRLFKQLPARTLPGRFSCFDLPTRRNPPPQTVLHQQHLSKGLVEYPNLGSKRLHRPLPGSGKPTASPVELGNRPLGIHGCRLGGPLVDHVPNHQANVPRRTDIGDQVQQVVRATGGRSARKATRQGARGPGSHSRDCEGVSARPRGLL